MKRPSLLRSMLSFSGMTFISRILGLVREIVIASTLGATVAADAFVVAFRIPNFLRRLFAEGSFSLAFVPVLTEYKEKRSHEELRELIARTAGTLGAVLMVVTALGVWGAPWVTRIFAPGSIDEPVKFALTSDLLRVTFPFLFFVSLTALAGGVLNAYSRFALPAFTPVILNLCIIAGALWLAPRLQIPVMALGWGVLVAGVLQLAIQLPALARMGVLSWPRPGWHDPGVRKIMKLMVPTLFGSSVAQVNLLFDTLIASFLVTGSQAWFGYSDRLLQFPLGMFGVAMGTVILPSLSRHHVVTDRAGFSRALDWGLRTALLIAVPAAIALVVLARPMLSTLYEHGKFNAFDVQMTTLSLTAAGFGLPAFALVKVLAPAFYSRQDTRTPVRAAVVAMLANIVMSVLILFGLLVAWRGPGVLGSGWLHALETTPGLHMALAISSAIAGYLNLAQLWRALRRAGVFTIEPGWLRFGVRLLVACAVMLAVLLAGRALWPHFVGRDSWVRVLHLAALVGGGGVAYLAALFAMGFRLRELRGV
jgi:putative peptidoglycan lipid II flippase